MRRRPPPASWLPLLLVMIFFAGVVTGWWTRGRIAIPVLDTAAVPPTVDTAGGDVNQPKSGPAHSPPPAGGSVQATTGERASAPSSDATASPSAAATASDVISVLRARHLVLPIDIASVDAMRGQFGDPREGGARGHEAVDIMAPRSTPIHAVDDGTIVKLFQSRPGGTTIYQFDPGGRFCYYYAHLQAYASGLHEGQHIARGQVIGYVGTTGNAPANAPHLHFAIFQLNADRHWWQGTALDPYLAFIE